MKEDKNHSENVPQEDLRQDDPADEEAPLFRKWSYWYALVIGALVILIFFFNFLTKHFA